MLWYFPGKQGVIDYIGYGWIVKGFHMPLKACSYRKKGMMLLPRGIARVQFVRGVCGTNIRVQVSDQRGTCLVKVEMPAKKGWPVSVAALNPIIVILI